jgi:hypothetical protein
MAGRRFRFADLQAELGLSDEDLVKLLCINQTTLWRWQTDGAPHYLRVILEQQQTIRRLSSALAASPAR